MGNFRRWAGLHLPSASGREVPDHRPRFPSRRATSTPTTSSSFDRQFNKENLNGDKYLPNLTWDYYTGMDMPKYVAKWEKVDDLIDKATLTEPNAPMPANLGMDFASILSKEYADQLREGRQDGRPVDTRPPGTGPFQFVDYQLDAVIRYAANPDYFKGKEKIDDLVRHHLDANAHPKVIAGECDVAPYPNPADIAMLKSNPDVTLLDQAGLNIGYIELQHHAAAARQA